MKNRFEIRGRDVVIFMPRKVSNEIHETVVDIDDLTMLQACRNTWHAAWSTAGKRWYAVSTLNRKQVFLHKLILGAGAEIQGDHRDGDSLNNRRSNLRKLTATGNLLARHRWRTNKKYNVPVGVYWDKALKKWRGKIEYRRRVICVGSFEDPHEAGRAVADKREELISLEEVKERE